MKCKTVFISSLCYHLFLYFYISNFFESLLQRFLFSTFACYHSIDHIARYEGGGVRGGEGEGLTESLQLRLWNLNSTPNSPFAPRRLGCQIFVSQTS